MKTKLLVLILILGLISIASAQNVSITLTPMASPIQIPTGGGSFDYLITATNNGTASQQATVWCLVTLPDGRINGPVVGPYTTTIAVGQTIGHQRTQAVPAAAPAGNYIFQVYVGIYPNTVWDSDSFPFVKLGAGGAALWVARYNGPANGFDHGLHLATAPDGSIYVAGQTFNGASYDILTLKYNSEGALLWERRYDGPGQATDYPNAIAIDNSGNVFVAGYGLGIGTLNDYVTIKYNAEGVQQWAARYDFGGHDWANAMILDADGNVYVTGGSASGYLNVATIKYDADGNQLWVQRYVYNTGHDYGQAMALDASGNLYVAGKSFRWDTYTDDCMTLKYAADGTLRWAVHYNGSNTRHDYGYDIVVDSESNSYITGICNSELIGPSQLERYGDYLTIKYDSTGNQIWAATYNGPANSTDNARALARDNDGNIFVTGYSVGDGAQYYDMVTIKYSPSGNPLWVARYDGPSPLHQWDWAFDIALDGSSHVFVTGFSDADTSYYQGGDYRTIKYDAAGNLIWSAAYNGPADSVDYAWRIALDGSGNACITGRSAGLGTNSDIATIKYVGGNLAGWEFPTVLLLGATPTNYRLDQNRPNPFNPTTVISFELRAASFVTLRVYDTAGCLVTELLNGWRDAGAHQITFDGSGLPSGIYFAKLEAGSYSQVQKLVLLK